MGEIIAIDSARQRRKADVKVSGKGNLLGEYLLLIGASALIGLILHLISED